jgi:hypothetical protein
VFQRSRASRQSAYPALAAACADNCNIQGTSCLSFASCRRSRRCKVGRCPSRAASSQEFEPKGQPCFAARSKKSALPSSAAISHIHFDRHPEFRSASRQAGSGFCIAYRHSCSSGKNASSPHPHTWHPMYGTLQAPSLSISGFTRSRRCQGTCASTYAGHPDAYSQDRTPAWPASQAESAASHTSNLRTSPAEPRPGLSKPKNCPCSCKRCKHCKWPALAAAMWSRQHCYTPRDIRSLADTLQGTYSSQADQELRGNSVTELYCIRIKIHEHRGQAVPPRQVPGSALRAGSYNNMDPAKPKPWSYLG